MEDLRSQRFMGSWPLPRANLLLAEHLDERDSAIDHCDLTHFLQLQLQHAVLDIKQDHTCPWTVKSDLN